MNLELKDKYKLEYAEVSNLRRHYSIVRASLTTFALTVSLAGFANYWSSDGKPPFLIFIGIFMLLAATFTCFTFSYASERANLYTEDLWRWFGADLQDPPPNFQNFRPSAFKVFPQMFRDEMNWAMLIAVALTIGACYFSTRSC
jgi:hypothetical protein